MAQLDNGTGWGPSRVGSGGGLGSILGAVGGSVLGDVLGSSDSLPYYQPKYQSDADNAWWQILGGQGDYNRLAGNANTGISSLLQSYSGPSRVDPSYLGYAANRAGQWYNNSLPTIRDQIGQYGRLYGNSQNLADQNSVAANNADYYANIFAPQSFGRGLLAYDTAYGNQDKLFNAGQNVFDYASDTQGDLYNREFNRFTDQVNAGQALRGIGNSAYGAKLYDDAARNFNLDWQDRQLNRRLAGANAFSTLGSSSTGQQSAGSMALSGLTNSASNALGTGASSRSGLTNSATYSNQNAQNALANLLGLYTTGAKNEYTAGSLPYESAIRGNQDYNSAINSYLSQLSGGQSVGNNILNQLGNYGKLSQSAISDYAKLLQYQQSVDAQNRGAWARLGANAFGDGGNNLIGEIGNFIGDLF